MGYGNGAANFYLGNYVSPTNPEPSNQRGHFAMEADNTTGDFFIYKPWPSPYSGDRHYIHIKQYGNVGIGTTNPTYKLDVNGRIRQAALLTLSDESLKTNIRFLTTEKDKLYQLNAYSYIKSLPVQKESKMRHVEEGKEDVGRVEINKDFFEYGFLAQEVEKIFPELVEQDENGLYSINYIAFIPIIIEALRDESTQIKALQTVIKEQQKQIDALLPEAGKEVQKISSPENETALLNVGGSPYLEQNTPNPFGQSTQINYYLPQSVQTAYLCFYDLQGKQLKQIKLAQRGEGFETISASQFSAGMYIYTLIADGKEIDTKRMILTE